MKKHLTSLLLVLPATVFAQSSSGVGEAIAFIFVFAIAVGLFLLFRGVILWYWKVNDIVKNQEETNRLLKSIVRNLESKDDRNDTQSIQ